MSTLAINLETLSEGMPGLTQAKGHALAEAAAVCLEHSGHSSGVLCDLTGIFTNAANLSWQAVDDQQRKTHADLQDATEDGAAAIGILTLKAMMGLSVMQRAVKGTGVDYWLGDGLGSGDELPFQNLTRLEVSGILKGARATVAERVRKKLIQTEPTDDVCPAFVAVVEYGKPVIAVEKK